MQSQERLRFVRQANELIESLGAIGEDDYWFLETKCGRLRLHVYDNSTTGPGTVFTCFDEPGRAKEHVECNPHSGKWNHHYFDLWEVDHALVDIEYQIKKVLDWVDQRPGPTRATWKEVQDAILAERRRLCRKQRKEYGGGVVETQDCFNFVLINEDGRLESPHDETVSFDRMPSRRDIEKWVGEFDFPCDVVSDDALYHHKSPSHRMRGRDPEHTRVWAEVNIYRHRP